LRRTWRCHDDVFVDDVVVVDDDDDDASFIWQVEEDVEVSRGFPEAVAAYLRAEHIAPVMMMMMMMMMLMTTMMMTMMRMTMTTTPVRSSRWPLRAGRKTPMTPPGSKQVEEDVEVS
jgi:hypothetical protein